MKRGLDRRSFVPDTYTCTYTRTQGPFPLTRTRTHRRRYTHVRTYGHLLDPLVHTCTRTSAHVYARVHSRPRYTRIRVHTRSHSCMPNTRVHSRTHLNSCTHTHTDTCHRPPTGHGEVFHSPEIKRRKCSWGFSNIETQNDRNTKMKIPNRRCGSWKTDTYIFTNVPPTHPTETVTPRLTKSA